MPISPTWVLRKWRNFSPPRLKRSTPQPQPLLHTDGRVKSLPVIGAKGQRFVIRIVRIAARTGGLRALGEGIFTNDHCSGSRARGVDDGSGNRIFPSAGVTDDVVVNINIERRVIQLDAYPRVVGIRNGGIE